GSEPRTVLQVVEPEEQAWLRGPNLAHDVGSITGKLPATDVVDLDGPDQLLVPDPDGPACARVEPGTNEPNPGHGRVMPEHLLRELGDLRQQIRRPGRVIVVEEHDPVVAG